MTTVRVDGMKKLEAKIQRLAKWSVKDAEKLRAIDARVAEVYNVALRANIVDANQEITVYNTTGGGPGRKKGRKGTKRQVIKTGTLRRSIKTFQRSNKAITLAGPKTRGKRGARVKTNRQDGWFASIVENSSGFGPSRNKGVFLRTQRATQNRMVKLRNRLLQREYKRFMR